MIHPIQAMPDVRVDSSVDLLLKAQSGDEDALNRLLARYLPRLRRWASGRLPWALRTMLDTGDLVQDAIVSALPHLNKLEIRTEHAFQFYLQRAVKNRIIDLHKRARRRPAREEIPEDAPAAGQLSRRTGDRGRSARTLRACARYPQGRREPGDRAASRARARLPGNSHPTWKAQRRRRSDGGHPSDGPAGRQDGPKPPMRFGW